MSNLVSISLLEQDVSGSYIPSWTFPEFPKQYLSTSQLQSIFLHEDSPFINASLNDTTTSTDGSINNEQFFVLAATNIFYIYFKPSKKNNKVLILETKDYHVKKYIALLQVLYNTVIEPQRDEKIISSINILSEFLTAFGKNRLNSGWDGNRGFSTPLEYKVTLFQEEFAYLPVEMLVNLWTAVCLKKKIVIRLDKSSQSQSFRVGNVAMALNCFAWNRINNWNQFINIGSEELLSTHHIFGDFLNSMGYDVLITINSPTDDKASRLTVHVHQNQIQTFEQTKHHAEVLKLFQEHKTFDTVLIANLNSLTKGILASLSEIDDLSYESLLEKSNQNAPYARFLYGLANAENLIQ